MRASLPLIHRLTLGAAVLLGAVPAFAATHAITVGGKANVFTPNVLNIAAGDTVVFTNAGGFHNAVSDAGATTAFTSGPASSDPWTLSVTFPDPGTNGYHCTIHGAAGQGMFGTINVTIPVGLQSFDID